MPTQYWCMLTASAVAGAYSAILWICLQYSGSDQPAPPRSVGTRKLMKPAALSSSQSSWKNLLSRSYPGARERKRSSISSVTIGRWAAEVAMWVGSSIRDCALLYVNSIGNSREHDVV